MQCTAYQEHGCISYILFCDITGTERRPQMKKLSVRIGALCQFKRQMQRLFSKTFFPTLQIMQLALLLMK